MGKKKKLDFQKRSEAAKKGWATRRKNANRYMPVLKNQDEDKSALAIRAIREQWTEKQYASVLHKLLDFPAHTPERRMAALFVMGDDIDFEASLNELAEELDIDVSELWANVFGS